MDLFFVVAKDMIIILFWKEIKLIELNKFDIRCCLLKYVIVDVLLGREYQVVIPLLITIFKWC